MTREEQILHAALEAGGQPRPIGKIWNSPLGRRVMSAYEIGFLDGAEWADEHPSNPYKDVIEHMSSNAYRVWKENLWHDAQGSDIPPIDEEVIVLCINGKVCFGHRPDPKGFNCKNVDTGEMEYLEPMTYDKGGWNIPDVRWWLDIELPNLEEKQ